MAVASHWQTGGLNSVLAALNAALAAPFALRWTEHSARFLLLFTLTYAVAAVVLVSDKCNTRPGAEHGSACWGDVSALNRKYRDKHGTNLLLTKHFQIGVDGYKHKHNTNVLVIGGSGAGKTRTYAVPNVLQAGCSMVITDPKAEILRKTGAFLLAQGYEVRVFDLIDPSASFCYNPFCYVQSDKDVLQLIADLIQNTTPPNAHENDPFWSKAETALLQALMLYLIHEAPADEQNFAMVMEMIAAAEVREDDADYQSPLDILFERLEMREPDSIACKQYRIFKQAAGKTARSILVSVGVRLAAFNLPQIARLTMADELHLEELGERKIALFCCIPDSDKSLNYLVGMIYSQLIQTLYRQADRVHRGRLPVPVHLLIDEFPNISLPKDSFLSALATMRSRGIFCSIIAQNMAQLKAMYKNDWESLVGLCDEFLYLGGNEQGTHKYVSELLGKGTIDKKSSGETKGRQGSSSRNYDVLGRELFTPDEVRKLDNKKCIIFIRGFDPIMDNKFIPFNHPMFNQTADGKGEPYVHQIRGADNLIGPPFEILSDKAVKYYEKLKDKGENVYIDSLTYEQFMMLGDAELSRRFSMQDEAEQKAKIDREQANELEYVDESQKSDASESANASSGSAGAKPVRNPEREKPKWEDTITNRMLHWSYTPEQKEEVKKALAAGVPKATILTYFYPEVTVEKMSSYRKKQ